MASPHLDTLTRVIDLLAHCSLALSRASRWAGVDRAETSIVSIGEIMKYWKLRLAKRLYREATQLLTTVNEARDLPEVELSLPASKLIAVALLGLAEMIADLLGIDGFTWTPVGTDGISPIKQRFGLEMTIYQRIETAKLEIDHLLSEVGGIHAKLRAA